MMGAEAFLYILFLVLLFFVFIRIRIEKTRFTQRTRIRGMAKCMTIGSRELQEDAVAFVAKEEGFMLVLADGMGREYAGRISSNIAVATIREFFTSMNPWEKPQYFFKNTFANANRKILDELDDQYGGAAVGLAIVAHDKLWYALAGNVQIAVYRNGELISISSGHTIGALAKTKWKDGEITRAEARQVSYNKRIYNYLGQDGFQDIETAEEIDLEPNDMIVLMSDGIYDKIRWRDIEDCLKYSKNADDAVYNIIERVNDLDDDNKDNASIVLAQV